MSDNRPLAGRTAWVTGSSRGIGREIALHLAQQGAAVALHGRTRESGATFGEAPSLVAAAEQLARETGAKTTAVWADLCLEAAVRSAAEFVRQELGPLDILVHAAGGDVGAAGPEGPGGGRPSPNDALDISTEDLRAVLDLNLLSGILVCRAAAPEMIRRRSGCIVLLGSTAAMWGRVDGAVYSAAKAGLHEYARCLAVQLRPHDVRVNVVAPGGTLSARFVATGQAKPERLDTASILEGYNQPADLAHTVAFLASDAGRRISGQILRVDGAEQCWPG